MESGHKREKNYGPQGSNITQLSKTDFPQSLTIPFPQGFIVY